MKSNAKMCTGCGQIKAFGEFHRHSGRKDGLQSWCKKCNHKCRAKKQVANPNFRRAENLRHRYNIDIKDFNKMLESQGNKCALCRREDQKWCVDHDHSCCPGQKTCGKCIRAILCYGCNTALGKFQDDPENLRRAAEYLERFKEAA